MYRVVIPEVYQLKGIVVEGARVQSLAKIERNSGCQATTGI